MMKQLIHNITTSISLPRVGARRLVLLLAALLVGVGNAWGAYDKTFYAKCRTISQPTQGGYVGIYQDAQKDNSLSFVTKTDDVTGVKSERKRGLGSGPSSTNIEFHAYQKANPGYSFQRWSTNPNATSGGITSTTNYNYWFTNYPYYSIEITATSTNSNSPTFETYYAIFSPNIYTVTYNANEGSVSPASKQVTYDATYGTLPTPTKTGYTFDGWFTSASGGNQVTPSTKVTTANDHTLYAHWTPITYYVAFDGNGKTAGTMSNETFTYNTSKALTKNAYTKTDAVTFNTNGGALVNATSPINVSATFDGWATSPTGAKVYNDEQSVKNLTTTQGATVTLYAHWSQNSSITLPKATKSGYVLAGWSTDGTQANIVGEADQSYAVPLGGKTLTAVWIEKYTPVMTGSNTSMSVGDEQNSAFHFEHVDNPVAHIAVQTISSVNNGDGQVIEYDSENNRIIAHNAGTATIYFEQAETSTIKYRKSITYAYTVTKVGNTLDVTTSTYEMFVGDELGQIINGNHVAIKDRNNNDVSVTVTSSDDDLLSYNPSADKISATNSANEMFGASKNVVLTFSQPETYKYTAVSKTITVTVKKHVTSLSCSRNSAVWNEIINDPFSSNRIGDIISVTAIDPTIASWDSGTRKITTYNQNGPASFMAELPETDSWTGLEQTFSITVGASVVNCYVLNDGTSHELHTIDNGFTLNLSGPGETLSFVARHGWFIDDAYDYMHIEATKIDGTKQEIYYSGARAFTTSDQTYQVHSIDPNIRSIRFYTTTGATLVKYISNIKVTRKTYLNASPSPITMDDIVKGQSTTKTFTVDYSCCEDEGNIVITSSDSHFTVSPSSISIPQGGKNGSQVVTVTYSSNDVGNHSATINIYNHSKSAQVTVNGKTLDKYTLDVSGDAQSAKVGQTIDAGYVFSYVNTSVTPSNPVDGDVEGFDSSLAGNHFYFTINHDLTGNETTEGSPDGTKVVSYNSATNEITALNAGVATITFHEAGSTYVSESADISFTITVSKHNPTFTWNLPNAEWASRYKFSDFFVSTNTTTSWWAVSNTDIAVYRSATDSIYTNYRSGAATFTVTQEENYYWNWFSQNVTTNVQCGDESTCYLYESEVNKDIRVWDFVQATWQDTAVAGKVIFDLKRGSLDGLGVVSLKVNQFVNGAQSQVGGDINSQSRDSWNTYERDLNVYATGVSFDNLGKVIGDGLDYSNHLKNVKVTRVPWIKASATDVTLPTIGKQGHSEATVTVYWSGVEPLRIEKKTNNPHFDVSPDAYFVQTPCTSGFSVLTLAYHSDEPGNETETIVIYDHAHSLEITLHGTTENKEMQEIVWNQSFNPILALGGTIDADSLLTAYATNRQGARTNQPITYTVGNTSIATIENGNHLHITNIGRTTITATVAGNGNYSGATKTLILNVLDGTGCGSLAFSNESEVTLFTITSDDALAVTRPAEDLYFEAKRDWIAFLNPAAQHVKMRYKVAGDNNWKTQDENGVEIETGALNSDWGSYGPFRLPENTEGIQFYTEFGAYFSQHVRNVYITQRSYLRKDKDALTANILVNTLTEVGEFTVEYSDKPTLIVENKCSNVKLFVDNPAPNECGTAGKYTYSVSCFSDTIGIIKDTVTVTSGLDDKLSVPVTIYVGIDGEFFFDNGIDHDITHTDWNVTQYWRKDNVYDHGRIPTMASLTTIEGPTVIDYDAYAYKMTITGSGKVTIAPNGSLKVGAGGIQGATMSNLIVEADNTGQTGILRLYPGIADEKIPDALVQIYTTAYWDRENGKKAVWQYIGTPVRNPDTNEHIFYQCWLYQYNQSLDKWKNAGNWGHMVPFQAYAFTRDKKSSGPLTGFGGQLNTLSIQNVDLTYIDKDHCENHLANSWTAPIYLKQFKPSDFQNVDPIIYCYTIEGKGLAKEIAVYTSDYTGNDILPAMQGFFVKARSNENPQLLLDYERLVWKNETSKNAPLRAPSRMNEEESDLSARICIQMTSADMVTDRIYLLEKDDEGFSPDYEVGYDAPKYFVDGLPCIYTYETSGPHLAVSATDDVVGTYLAINTGASQDYTLTFSKVIGEGLGLRDLVTNTIVPIIEGMQYAFTAPANSSPMLRFVVVEHEETPQWNNNNGTSLEDVGGEFKIWQSGEILSVIGAGSHASLRIYDAAGKLILSEFFNEATAINLNALPTGVYMVQVNDKTEKVLR